MPVFSSSLMPRPLLHTTSDGEWGLAIKAHCQFDHLVLKIFFIKGDVKYVRPPLVVRKRLQQLKNINMNTYVEEWDGPIYRRKYFYLWTPTTADCETVRQRVERMRELMLVVKAMMKEEFEKNKFCE